MKPQLPVPGLSGPFGMFSSLANAALAREQMNRDAGIPTFSQLLQNRIQPRIPPQLLPDEEQKEVPVNQEPIASDAVAHDYSVPGIDDETVPLILPPSEEEKQWVVDQIAQQPGLTLEQQQNVVDQYEQRRRDDIAQQQQIAINEMDRLEIRDQSFRRMIREQIASYVMPLITFKSVTDLMALAWTTYRDNKILADLAKHDHIDLPSDYDIS